MITCRGSCHRPLCAFALNSYGRMMGSPRVSLRIFLTRDVYHAPGAGLSGKTDDDWIVLGFTRVLRQEDEMAARWASLTARLQGHRTTLRIAILAASAFVAGTAIGPSSDLFGRYPSVRTASAQNTDRTETYKLLKLF